MRKVVYSFAVSLDGYIAGPGGDIGWTVPDEELHRFHNEQGRATGVYLYGRRLYETMRYWEEDHPGQAAHEDEWARAWRKTPRLVFSRTLERAEGGAELVHDDPADVVAQLSEQPGGDIAVGGAGLAARLVERNLIDEYGLFVYPVVLGAGTPFFPPLADRIALELVETRTFGSQVVYLRYLRRG